MSEFAARLFSTKGFMPHGHCFLWNPSLLWLHVVSDGLTALAYMTIPFTLVYFIRRRRDLPFNAVFVCFSVFILACGATHLVDIWTLWTPVYWLAGALKAITAAASVATALVLVKLVPRALAIPAPSALSAAHQELRRANEQLEARVLARTAELTTRNQELASEVAERKRAETALHLSEARFTRLSDAGILGIITADLGGPIADANDSFLRMLGYTRAELLAGKMHWPDLTPPEYAAGDERAVAQLRATGAMAVWEKEYLHADGHRVPVLTGGAMLKGEDDVCITFVLDLSDQKRTESAMGQLRTQHASDERFRAILDSAPDAMVVTDSDGMITLVNARTEALFGYSRQELVGQRLELLIPERYRGGHHRHVAQYQASPATRPMGSGLELFGRRKNGTELPIEVSLSPLQSASGTTVSAAIRDITERKRMEDAARLLAERLSSAVESMLDAFALFDGSNHLVLCNSAYRELCSDTIEGSLVGRSYQELLDAWIDRIEFTSQADQEGFRRERLTRILTDTATAVDVRLRDGRSLRVIDRRTAEGGIVKTIWDLTEDVQLAEELRTARVVAEGANRAKSDFLSSMSHEIRTPLNAILGFAQLLERDRKEPLSDRHKKRVAQILQGGEHLLHLIDDILDLSRIEAGKVAVSLEPVAIRNVIEEMRSTLEPLATEHQVQITLDPLPVPAPCIAADRTRFAQILMNFGSNAIKYNRPGGAVFVSVFVVGQSVRVVVRDTGLGIPTDRQAQLFQPFQRAGQETGVIQGTGIGLFISQRLAELMHGSVGFRSVVGEGSEFWVDMPAVRASELHSDRLLSAVPPAAAVGTTRQRLLLYVEDNPANVAFMRDLVSSMDDVELISCSSAEAGVALARERAPDVILMDINLPGMNGFEALQALRATTATNQIPVIALTAAASARDRERGLQDGFYAYMTKPIQVETLIATLDTLLGRS
jgi:PAS domain S-box-containing protein